jgi:hypothetical protein
MFSKPLGLAIAMAPWLHFACAAGPGKNSEATPARAPSPTVTLFALAEVRGQVEPCGCTTDPLGDMARTAQLIAAARQAGPVVVVDAGGLLYSENPIPPQLAAQEELKADFLAQLYLDTLKVDAVGVGPADLVKGVDKLRLPRHLANAAVPAAWVSAPRVIPAGGKKIGVFALATPAMVPGVEVTDPVAAGKATLEQLREHGADVVVALVQAESRKAALQILREVGPINVAVLGLGQQAPEPKDVSPRAEQVDGTWVVTPGNRGQVVTRIDLTLRDGSSTLVDAVGPAAAEATLAALDQQLAALDGELARFASDPGADPRFVATKREEKQQLTTQRAALAANPTQVPARGSYFTVEQVRIHKSLACAPTVLAAKTALDQASGEANVKLAATLTPALLAKGQPRFVGAEACSDCHDEQLQFWKTTRHAQAWKTLEDRSKQFDYECTSCHVTALDRPGGSTLAQNAHLRDVQCETCHGPGSIHIAKEGAAGTITRVPAAELCAQQCHTPEHSDTFEAAAYLRDIVGPGHGEARRKELGDGPTGRELRSAGLEKAGKTLGAGCTK